MLPANGCLTNQSLRGLWLHRLKVATQQTIEQAISNKEIVRTWPMRGTLHLVTAVDIRWLLALLTPRVLAGAAGRHKQLELDEAAFTRAESLFISALRSSRQKAHRVHSWDEWRSRLH
jgi:hypothetical protein